MFGEESLDNDAQNQLHFNNIQTQSLCLNNREKTNALNGEAL